MWQCVQFGPTGLSIYTFPTSQFDKSFIILFIIQMFCIILILILSIILSTRDSSIDATFCSYFFILKLKWCPLSVYIFLY
jgi:hypothetical protein